MNEISALSRVTREPTSPLLSAMFRYKKLAMCNLEEDPHQNLTRPARPLI